MAFFLDDAETVVLPKAPDLVIASLTFKHFFPSFETALANLARQARPGCRFAFDLIEGVSRRFEPDGVTFVRAYTREETGTILEAAGLRPIAFDQVAHSVDPAHVRLFVAAEKPAWRPTRGAPGAPRSSRPWRAGTLFPRLRRRGGADVGERFKGRIVVVTGASSGVGAETARLFAREGARVVLAARTAAALESVAKEIGERAIAVPTDVADPDAARALLRRAAEPGDHIDVLVNNAAVNHRGPIEKVEPDALGQIVDVNLRGPVVLTRLALPYLRRSGRGAVVNVASIAGQIPLPEEAAYSATKFGLRGFSFALAEELRGSGVTVGVVSPGPIETGFITDDLDNVPDLVFSQPMSTPGDVARAVLDSADDGRLERTMPRLTGALATAGYLVPEIPRLLRPLLVEQGRRAKAKFRKRHGA